MVPGLLGGWIWYKSTNESWSKNPPIKAHQKTTYQTALAVHWHEIQLQSEHILGQRKEEWQPQGSKMNHDSAWVEWSRKHERCQTSVQVTANLGKEQYENHATFNRGRPDKLTKTESETQGTEATGKGIHYSLHWITHNCQLQRNCFLCSYNLTNPIAIHTIAIQSQHTLCRRL